MLGSALGPSQIKHPTGPPHLGDTVSMDPSQHNAFELFSFSMRGMTVTTRVHSPSMAI
jgi:hypothetical protein